MKETVNKIDKTINELTELKAIIENKDPTPIYLNYSEYSGQWSVIDKQYFPKCVTYTKGISFTHKGEKFMYIEF